MTDLPETGVVKQNNLIVAVEQAAEGIVITDTTGKIQYVNPAFTAITGYSREESVGQNPRVLKSGRQSAVFYKELWNTIASGRVWQGELENRRKDGTLYNEEMSITPVRSTNGEIVTYIAIKRDVTERRAAEETQKLLASIVESSTDAIITYSPAGNILSWNRGAEAIFSYAAADAIGRDVSMLALPGRRVEVTRFTKTIVQGHAVSPYETVCLRQGGRRIHVSLTGSPIRNRDGEVVAISTIFRDISERRRAEEALIESEERFRTMADGCPAIMWVTDAEGRTRFVNRTYLEYFGTTEEALRGEMWPALLHPEDQPEYVEAFQRAVAEHTRFKAEARALRADGSWRLIGSRAEPRLSASGEFLGHVGMSADITERKRTEQALQFKHSLICAIHEVSLDGILVVSDANLIVSHNRRFLEIWQIPLTKIPDDLPDYPIGDQPPLILSAVLDRVKDPDAFLRRIRELNGDPDADDHCEIQLKDGRTLERYSTSLRSETGSHLGRVWFFRDITKRKQAEQALQTSEEKFRQLAENIREVFWMMPPAAQRDTLCQPGIRTGLGQDPRQHLPESDVLDGGNPS